MMIFSGSAVALVTPYTENGIDYGTMAELIEFQIGNGTDGIVIAGTTGEASTMTDEEYEQVLRFSVEKVAGRVPVIAGAGSNSTQKAIEHSQLAQRIGVDGLLVVTPYYNKGTQKGLLAHFTEIAKSVELPIIAYNVPSRTGMNILPGTVSQLAKVENIVGLKEASGDISQIAQIMSCVPKEFAVYSGNDDSIVPLLSLGGKGVISVVANVLPRETSELVHSYFDGNVERSRELQLSMIDLVNALFLETNPIPVKHALNLMGFKAGQLRLPLTEMSEEGKGVLAREMRNYGILGVD